MCFPPFKSSSGPTDAELTTGMCQPQSIVKTIVALLKITKIIGMTDCNFKEVNFHGGIKHMQRLCRQLLMSHINFGSS